MPRHQRFDAWKLTHQLAVRIHAVSKAFPRDERYVLTAQIRKAAMSVPANIAEGAAKRGPREFARYLDIALGSLNEVAELLDYAHGVQYVNKKDWKELRRLRNRAGYVTWTLYRSMRRK